MSGSVAPRAVGDPAPVARPRPRAGPTPTEAAVRAALRAVVDPEIPAISIVDLGIVGRIAVALDTIQVELLPTFVACPAMELIRSAVVERLAGLAPRIAVDVRFVFDPPWTSDRITDAGRAALRRSGIAPPAGVGRALPVVSLDPGPVRCPYCGSRRTVLENPFGPALCRAIHHCTACRQPFERFKAG